MKRMEEIKRGRQFFALNCDKGQAMTEYILVLVLIIVGFIIALEFVGFQEVLDAAVAFIAGKLPGGPPGS